VNSDAPVDRFLDRLEKAHRVGDGRWRACCPAHGGTNPNALSIRETGDGTLLVKCFSGCGASEVVRAVGLELHDLFPRDPSWSTAGHHIAPRQPRVDWPGLIKAVELDAVLVCIMLAQIGRGESVCDVDAIAAKAAAQRLSQTIAAARHA
jgi:hypothetical protein